MGRTVKLALLPYLSSNTCKNSEFTYVELVVSGMLLTKIPLFRVCMFSTVLPWVVIYSFNVFNGVSQLSQHSMEYVKS